MKIFNNKHILSTEQFNSEDINQLFKNADRMKNLVENKGGDNSLRGKIIAAIFYEPSSRTFGSFIAAAQRLGGGFIPIHGIENTSIKKGETLEDTIRAFGSYADAIVLRHPKKGAARKAAKVSYVPIINAGDGSGEHPTQALLDLYTIRNHFNLDKKITIGIAGDLKYGRTVHSLAKLLTNYTNFEILFISPKKLKIPNYLKEYLKVNNLKYTETEDLQKKISEINVLYMTRVQKERFTNVIEYNKVKNIYILDQTTTDKMKKNSIVMHPLPRINEISPAVDNNPRSVYFAEQMKNGLFVRMALLKDILS